MATNDFDYLGDYGRAKDAACKVEADLPAEARATRPSPVLTPADLDEAFGTYRPTEAAAAQRRVRDTWHK